MNNDTSLDNKKKVHYLKWIYLVIILLINIFIIVQAALPASQSARWSDIFVRFFMNIFNGSGKDTTEVIPVEDININYDKDYRYNYIGGYQDNELVIGTTKRLVSVVSPDNATNTAVSYSLNDDKLASITQDEKYLYVKGLEEGTLEITATSLGDNSLIAKYTFNVVMPKAPTTYVVNDIEIYKDSLFYLPISIDNPSYYDLSKLDVSHTNPMVTNRSDTYEGLYYATNNGIDTYQIGSKSFNVTVIDNSEVILPHFVSIIGKDTLYSSSSESYQVNIDNEASSKDVMWSIDNNEVASISREGKLTIKDIKEETSLIVTATSLLDSSISISKEVIIKPVTITSFELVIPYYGNHVTNSNYMGETGEEIKIWMEDNTGTIGISGVSVSSTDESVAKVYAQGSYIYINCIKEGDTRIIVTSLNNPNVSKYIDLQVVIRGVINHDNYKSFSELVRKSIGHFLLFLVNGVFTFLFMYELNKDVNYKHKKKWHYIVVTLLFGLLLAGLSEFIQFLVPTRFGSFVDVGIDTLGFFIGVGITLLVVYLINRHKHIKMEKTNVIS